MCVSIICVSMCVSLCVLNLNTFPVDLDMLLHLGTSGGEVIVWTGSEVCIRPGLLLILL